MIAIRHHLVWQQERRGPGPRPGTVAEFVADLERASRTAVGSTRIDQADVAEAAAVAARGLAAHLGSRCGAGRSWETHEVLSTDMQRTVAPERPCYTCSV
ncbi:hypothetical protein ACFPM0_28630 [Pseudonocardia sulfidoxydans]|uniref:hypothetical protein n=1 Tax=Pseudonocardia sulfidoxydans TaxID=54011 RepID=UPI003606EE78